MSKPVIFVIGGPGSGKGTQCDKIVKKYGFTHLSTGDLIRAEIKSGSDLGKQVNEIVKTGQLVANDIVLSLLKTAINKESAKSNGFLIDGYPRERDQAISFERDVTPCDMVLYFDCSDEEMTKRLLSRGQTSGRSDDNADTIRDRLKTFHKHSQPVVDYLGKKVRKISAQNRDPEDIFKEVSKAIDSLPKKS
ncbi:adenylate kinase isoenzyme 1-like [Oppia nitens]|uniref:adenylate kinase isoenzyme 1-like n=1 Tax=Oppia nitens TaxID=1686743 RepID=UPI0023DCE87C|nr:adenylate kinase isoenzyme 1-like [Oppia nitens]XP_054166438.1 adenylate kinase isoenzyme 1-like [Oppia nitens]